MVAYLWSMSFFFVQWLYNIAPLIWIGHPLPYRSAEECHFSTLEAVRGNDTSSGDSLGTSSEVSVLTGLYNFPIYLGWVLIPMFIITVPIGFILFFKKPNFKKTTIILISIICSLPAFYAYSYPLQEVLKYYYSIMPDHSALVVYDFGYLTMDYCPDEKNLVSSYGVTMFFSVY